MEKPHRRYKTFTCKVRTLIIDKCFTQIPLTGWEQSNWLRSPLPFLALQMLNLTSEKKILRYEGREMLAQSEQRGGGCPTHPSKCSGPGWMEL